MPGPQTIEALQQRVSELEDEQEKLIHKLKADEALLLEVCKTDGWLRTDETSDLWERLQKWEAEYNQGATGSGSGS